MRWSASLVALSLGWTLLVHAGEPGPVVHLLVPGFTVRELPVRLSNINNLRFAPDGRLTALAYDGRVWLLRDTDGDGLEDTADLYWDKPTISVPVGMAWSTAGLLVSSHGKVSLLRDTNGDGKADLEEIIASGWPPTDVGSGGVDATAVTLDHEGNVYFGLITADYSNPYRVKDGVSHYDLNGLRGTIQKWYAKTRTLETVANGIRVPYTLAFNRAGDLFVTDQEGATWCPGGNPLDELDYIIPGHNYGFPPRDEKWLPNLVSDAPVVAFGPQHQSSCGLVFNEPHGPLNRRLETGNQAPALPASPGQGLFGPKWWEGDALVAGESRGKIWRVRLVKTPHGYIGREYTIARLSMLTLDVAISPKGDLYVCCHSGQPDWGTGPQGQGRIFKISYTDPAAPQPVVTWAASPMEVRVAFDKPLDPSVTNHVGEMRIEFGEYVRAADRYEVLKPPYQAVKDQEATPRGKLNVVAAKLEDGGRTLVLTTSPHPLVVHYGLTIPGVKGPGQKGAGATVDTDYDLSGVEVRLTKRRPVVELPNGRGVAVPDRFAAVAEHLPQPLTPKVALVSPGWRGWLPTANLEVARELLRGSEVFERFDAEWRKHLAGPLFVDAVCPMALGDARVRASSAHGFMLIQAGEQSLPTRDSTGTYSVILPTPRRGEPWDFTLSGQGGFDFTYSSSQDATIRPVALSALLVPWAPTRALPAPSVPQPQPELTGGDWLAGKDLFFGDRLKCSTCHRVRGDGGTVGPDLGNLPHRDAASVLRDIKDPSATINPDYVAFNVELKGGGAITGFVRAQDADSLSVVGADGQEMKVPRSEVADLRASSVSLMPTGLVDGVPDSQVRDLLTFLLSEPPSRTRSEIEALLGAAGPTPSQASGGVAGEGTGDRSTASRKSQIANRQLSIVLVASKQDHGPGQHDYPAWQKKWSEWLGHASGVTVQEAWLWPTPGQFQNANVIVCYFWNHDWSADRYRQLDEFMARGGGVVLLHSGTIADQDPERLAERFGLAAQPNRSKYRHTPLDLRIVSTANSPITRGFPPEVHFLDEPYWPMIGDTNRVQVLASTVEDGHDQPLVWTFQEGKGRVFGCVLGHFTWTLDDPLYRLLVLRGLDWAAGGEGRRFDDDVARDWQSSSATRR